MDKHFHPLNRLSVSERSRLLMPMAVTVLLLEGLLVLFGIQKAPAAEIDLAFLLFGGIGIVYSLLLFFLLFSWADRHYPYHWLLAALNGLGIALLARLTPYPSFLLTASIAGIFITITALLAGRGPAYLLTFVYMVSSLPWFTAALSHPPMEWINIIAMPVFIIIISETILRLSASLNEQSRRLEILNEFARKIGSSLEIDQVIQLVSSAIRDSFRGDTYYFGILQGETLRLELFYDDGEFFEDVEVPLGDGLASWVLKNNQSLRVEDIPADLPQLGITQVTAGKPKSSLSWMGTPIKAGGHLIGIFAVASYARKAFSPADLSLLEGVAQEAALAIDNAYHHESVEEQSRLDSLTQVYTHGYFLQRLTAEMAAFQDASSTLSLIMLDIDFFKQYNDRYGHLIGDEVLTKVATTIKRYIKKSDVVGRWGGEEFAVLLLNATGKQAFLVAERIRQTLQNLQLKDHQGNTIPAPTVSQGIAWFPFEAQQAEEFVHQADLRLYVAKERGRNQVEPAPSYWDELNFALQAP